MKFLEYVILILREILTETSNILPPFFLVLWPVLQARSYLFNFVKKKPLNKKTPLVMYLDTMYFSLWIFHSKCPVMELQNFLEKNLVKEKSVYSYGRMKQRPGYYTTK